MAKDYLNPFRVYGSSHREDNFTRAWLSTLKSLAPAHARLFLRDVLLADRPDLQQTINFSSAEDLIFDFQIPDSTGEVGDLAPEEAALITIDASGDQELSFVESSSNGGSRPDGLIVDPGSGITAVIEVKLYGGQQSSQLTRHHDAFFDTFQSSPDDVWSSVDWTTADDFLDQLRDRGTSEHERYMLTNFVEYAESLGLAPFRGFRLEHLADHDETTLRKYMRAVNSAMEERGIETSWEEGRPKYLGFPDRRDNLWADYSGTGAFRFGIVSGADSKSTCKSLQATLRDEPDALGDFATELCQWAHEERPEVTVRFRPHLRFYYSRFRNWWVHCRGHGYVMPEEYDDFQDHMVDPERNPLERLSRSKLTELFDEVLDGRGKERGPDGLFPPPPDADPVLVNLYLHTDLYYPAEFMLDLEREEAIELGADVCEMLYEKTGELEEIY